ncbi:DNA primase [Desulfospira joergensenii]|uniref:DNA primase n=1 Tax=Desulfospira joergensenii TaxID=53329 RepID=UPI0003B68215|nr:DNA primase [Desulfospira joergensenii]
MYVPEEKISEILNTSDIVELVSESVILKKSGRNFFGLCPFHSEKTPSFSVNPNKQIFYCFGCGAGGNALAFVMKYHGIGFPEAARMLARKHNIPIETKDLDPAKKQQIQSRESLFRLNKKVMSYYSGILKEDPAGKIAGAYLEKRGTHPDIIDRFCLGYSADKWDGAVGFLRKEKVGRKTALNSGLILPRKQGQGFYDRFRNRIMFPIFDINMQVAGFGGRVMDDAMPKYLNSPETPVYSKGRILYGLHAAKQHCRQEGSVYIVEGYFDFLSLFQHGIKNCVASLGTALTSEHVRILKGYASKMVLVFDSDAAGINAAKRSIKIFMQEGVDTRILVLPDGNDPDSFVMSRGRDAWDGVAKGAKTIMEFLLHLSMETHGLTVEGRVKILEDMKAYLAEISDSALRSLYVKELSETLNIDEKAVLEKVRDQVNRKGSHAPRGRLEEEIPKESDPLEEQLVSMMLNFPETIPDLIQAKVFDFFQSDRLRKIAQLISRTDPGDSGLVNEILGRVGGEADQELIASLAMKGSMAKEEEKVENIHETAGDIIKRFIRVRKKNENKITTKIISAERGGDADVMELLKLKQQEIQEYSR